MEMNEVAMPEIVVTGFPKCGTTALMSAFENDPEITTLRAPDGAIEVSWPAIKEVRPAAHPGGILAHKFTAYAYNAEAMRYLVDANPDSILVLCVRDPVRSLVSWHKMHQSIARSGKNPGHFAYQERDFYADCSIEDYYGHFAKRRLRYDLHFQNMLEIVPASRLVVVSQERMAKGISEVADHLKAVARGSTTPLAEPTGSTEAHQGYADRADRSLPLAMRNELKRIHGRLYEAIAVSGVQNCL